MLSKREMVAITFGAARIAIVISPIQMWTVSLGSRTRSLLIVNITVKIAATHYAISSKREKPATTFGDAPIAIARRPTKMLMVGQAIKTLKFLTASTPAENVVNL
jgi:hypothetical protein